MQRASFMICKLWMDGGFIESEDNMSFSGAVFALMRGHKVKRHHWTGYWYKNEDGEIIMHTHNGEKLNLKDTKDMIYTLSNCACDDWEIITDWN